MDRDGRVKMTVPEGAADEALVTIRQPAVIPPNSPSGQPFEIIANGQTSKQEVHQLMSLTIEVDYDPDNLTQDPALPGGLLRHGETVLVAVTDLGGSNKSQAGGKKRPFDHIRWTFSGGKLPAAGPAGIPGVTVHRSGDLCAADLDPTGTGGFAAQAGVEL